METITGVITEAVSVRHTVYGNPIKLVSITGPLGSIHNIETMPNAQLGYNIGNYLGKAVKVSLRQYRGSTRIESVVAL